MEFFNLGDSLFEKKLTIPDGTQVVFVADAFAEDIKGGAELSTEALITSSPFSVFKLHSKDVNIKLLEQGHSCFWIFGNFASLNKNLIPTIVSNMQYSVIEYDYKYCRYRSPEKHEVNEKQPCDCHNELNGKMISAFMLGAKSLWWMSEKQKNLYETLFPFLGEKVESTVLSSVFDDETFSAIKLLRSSQKNEKKGWVVLGSPSWIKGTEEAKKYCEDNGLDYEVVWGLAYDKMLEKLSRSKGLVFLPQGGDTCPRLVIEAKLLGCELILNDNVQHKDEIWFNTNDMLDTESYLYLCRDRFWNGIRADMLYSPEISGYTTTRNCIEQDYPFVECITSMLGFCDEVVVVDGGSKDGTWEMLQELAKNEDRLIIHQHIRDWETKRFAVFDGAQKALARTLCTKEFCWQMDSDEIVHEKDYDAIKKLAKMMPKDISIIALPLIEYWGNTEKVRMDITMWKWRLSKNLPYITHGIPKQFRRFDDAGELYSAEGCDGCFYIRSDNYEIVPCASFWTQDMDKIRAHALVDDSVRQQFERWFKTVISQLPSVHHFSWFNIERKIKTYKNYWSRHWESLYNVIQNDSAENNMFFDKPWCDVTDDEIFAMAQELKEKMGGWVFHKKVDFLNPIPHLNIETSIPTIMEDWVERNK